MSKKDLEAFLSNNKFTDFDSKVIRLKALGVNNNDILVRLSCARAELFLAYERITKDILESKKKTLVCNSNAAKVLQENDISKNFKIVISEYVGDNQCLLYDDLEECYYDSERIS